MSLRLYFPDEIRAVLAGIASAGRLNGPEYQRAIADVAAALGMRIDAPARVVPGDWPASLRTIDATESPSSQH